MNYFVEHSRKYLEICEENEKLKTTIKDLQFDQQYAVEQGKVITQLIALCIEAYKCLRHNTFRNTERDIKRKLKSITKQNPVTYKELNESKSSLLSIAADLKHCLIDMIIKFEIMHLTVKPYLTISAAPKKLITRAQARKMLGEVSELKEKNLSEIVNVAFNVKKNYQDYVKSHFVNAIINFIMKKISAIAIDNEVTQISLAKLDLPDEFSKLKEIFFYEKKLSLETLKAHVVDLVKSLNPREIYYFEEQNNLILKD